MWRHGRCQLWHYRNDDVRVSPPLLIVFSLFSRSYILDLQPGNSFVERLLAAGFDVYLLDWGVPDERDAANRLDDYVDDYLPAAVDRVRRIAGTEQINMLGYCFGSVLALLYAAHHLDAPLRSLTVMTTPVDLQQLGPLTSVIGGDGLNIDNVLDENGNVPPQVVHQGFQVLKPTTQITQYVDLWERMWSDDYVAAHQAMIGWATDHIPLPGGVARQLAEMTRDNAIVNDTLVVGGDRVHLADITVPFLTVLGTRDHIVPEASAGPLIDPDRLARQTRAAPRRWARRAARRPHRRQDHHPHDHRIPPPAKRDTAMNIDALRRDHTDALIEFFARLPAEDLTLMRADVAEPDTVRGWADRPAHWVALDDAAVVVDSPRCARCPAGPTSSANCASSSTRPIDASASAARWPATHSPTRSAQAAAKWSSNSPQTRNTRWPIRLARLHRRGAAARPHPRPPGQPARPAHARPLRRRHLVLHRHRRGRCRTRPAGKHPVTATAQRGHTTVQPPALLRMAYPAPESRS